MARRRKVYIRFTSREYSRGSRVPVSAIYECSECENINAFKRGEKFDICESCKSEDESQHWLPTNVLLHFVTKNLNTEFERIETLGLKTADFISKFSGSLAFVFVHLVWFWAWIYVNTGGMLFGIKNFDPYPFGLLTMIVSLEAIILSTFILISQNRQAQKSELRAELDYQTNLNTEKGVAEVLAILKELREESEALSKKTGEILEDTTQITEPKKKPKASKKKPDNAHGIMRAAGIDVVQNNPRKKA